MGHTICIIFNMMANLKERLLLLHVMNLRRSGILFRLFLFKMNKIVIPSIKPVSLLQCDRVNLADIITLHFF